MNQTSMLDTLSWARLGFPIALSLQVATVSVAILIVPGLWFGLLLARRRFRGRALVDAVLLLPLVLPPSVTGYALLRLFGRTGPVGAPLFRATGLAAPFTFWGAVLAAIAVALPLFVITARATFSPVVAEMEELAWTLGLTRARTFFFVTLRLASRGIVAATILAFARAAGEFGATLMMAGNIPGRTNTMALELFSAWQRGDDQLAFILACVMAMLSLLVVVAANRLARLP